MQKFHLVLAVLTAAVVAPCYGSLSERQAMLGNNDTPKQRAENPEVSVCDDCILVARGLKEVVKDAEKLEKFKTELEMLCAMLQPEQALLDNPRAFCQKLGLCPSDGENVAVAPLPSPRLVHLLMMAMKRQLRDEPQSSAVACGECVMAMSELSQMMSAEENLNTAIGTLHSLCAHSNDQSAASTCTRMVDAYLPTLWSVAGGMLQGRRCAQLGFCPVDEQQFAAENKIEMELKAMLQEASVSLQTQLSEGQVKGFSVTCLLCEVGLRGMVGYLRDSKGVLEKASWGVQWYVCGKLGPVQWNSTCADFLQLYLVPVMQMTLDQVDTNVDTVCTWVHACKKTDDNTVAALAVLSKSERSWLVCSACKLAANALHNELSNVPIQDKLVDYLQKFCATLIGEWHDECLGLIGSYVPGALQTFADLFYPEYICQEVKLCPLGIEMPATVDQHKLIKASNDI